MKAHEFITAYSRSRPRLSVRDAQLDGFLEESRDYAFWYGELLHDFLSGQLRTSRQVLHAGQRSYLGWLDTEPLFTQIVAYVSERECLEEAFIRTLMEFNFHRLNRPMLPSWDVALYPGGMSRRSVQEVRTLVAIAALELVNDREFALREDAWFMDNDEARLLRSGLTGALAECDALIALLEVTRRDELVLVLPAPPQFEHAHRSTNVDFVVIDKRTDSVLGIQVKASTGLGSRAGYDPDRVMMLDTSQDLEDRLAMRTRPLSSDKRVVPWPGLIAAHYLRDIPIPRRGGIFADPREMVKWKGRGRHFAGETKSRNEVVFGDVADRVLARLRGT